MSRCAMTPCGARASAVEERWTYLNWYFARPPIGVVFEDEKRELVAVLPPAKSAIYCRRGGEGTHVAGGRSGSCCQSGSDYRKHDDERFQLTQTRSLCRLFASSLSALMCMYTTCAVEDNGVEDSRTGNVDETDGRRTPRYLLPLAGDQVWHFAKTDFWLPAICHSCILVVSLQAGNV